MTEARFRLLLPVPGVGLRGGLIFADPEAAWAAADATSAAFGLPRGVVVIESTHGHRPVRAGRWPDGKRVRPPTTQSAVWGANLDRADRALAEARAALATLGARLTILQRLHAHYRHTLDRRAGMWEASRDAAHIRRFLAAPVPGLTVGLDPVADGLRALRTIPAPRGFGHHSVLPRKPKGTR